jgi:hypothetical protein
MAWDDGRWMEDGVWWIVDRGSWVNDEIGPPAPSYHDRTRRPCKWSKAEEGLQQTATAHEELHPGSVLGTRKSKSRRIAERPLPLSLSAWMGLIRSRPAQSRDFWGKNNEQGRWGPEGGGGVGWRGRTRERGVQAGRPMTLMGLPDGCPLGDLGHLKKNGRGRALSCPITHPCMPSWSRSWDGYRWMLTGEL